MHPQHRSIGVLPQPEPEEETKPFILDLKNFPDLANADINSQNPNIQVSRRRGVTYFFAFGNEKGAQGLRVNKMYQLKFNSTAGNTAQSKRATKT